MLSPRRTIVLATLLLAPALACDSKPPETKPDAKAKPEPKAETNTNKPTESPDASKPAIPEGHVAHFADALAATLAGQAIAAPETKAWGCSVKYADAGSPATAKIGEPAPAFSLPDLDGKTITLAELAGKTVVLEWFNPDCPFVKHAHGEGPLKTMAKDQTAKGVVWLAINSGAPGKQGTGAERNREAKTEWNLEHPILLDESGTVGHAYGATNTPHMFVIDPQGKLVYAGALDNAPLGSVE